METMDLTGVVTDPIDAFHELLSTLSGALDVRDVFQRLSTVVARIVAHDEANLALRTEDGAHFRLYASTQEGEPELLCPDEHSALCDPLNARLFHDGYGSERGFRSGLQVPVRVDGKPIGGLMLLSHRPDAFSARQLHLAERVADYVAIAVSHQRLAEAGRRAALERDRAANLESSVELLRAIAGVLDIRKVFTRVSEIANKVLPHDFMTMSFDNGKGEIIMQARSTDEFTQVDWIRLVDRKHRTEGRDGVFLVSDLRQQSLPIAEPVDLQDRIVSAGYRSFLAVNASARDQMLGVEFWSRRPNAFTEIDVPIARRIADHIALAVSHEQLADAARQVAEVRARAERLEVRVQSLAEELDMKTGHGRVVGRSDEWRDVLRKATQVAATETTVLLTGESGTGKEVLARFIHRASTRKNGPFVALNCAALPEQLLESELFGYERGAFTGAQHSKPGQIELASEGVLFLDEVSEMSVSAQAKFLRVLQEREFQRLGGTRLQKANVRVIAATNRDLRKAVERHDFREDLYYRIQVFEVPIPPLRDRRDDILLLTDAFLDDIGRSLGRPPAGLTREAKSALLRHTWPGNVRELRNALERAAILCEGGLITADHLSLRTDRAPVTMIHDLSAVERETIEQVMSDTGWNKSKAAKRLGLTRTQLYGRLRKYDIDRRPQA
ncbi:MAG TPA: sigma 54-interacting transcriptional regulator [Vicinamibacterales bacterium]|nr:sigma 54-interacting transcriptional regulator [Vicinamibacterales bacterium]